jgi:hypothetical protein
MGDATRVTCPECGGDGSTWARVDHFTDCVHVPRFTVCPVCRTSLAAKRQPMTEEEADALARARFGTLVGVEANRLLLREFVRDVERTHGITGGENG